MNLRETEGFLGTDAHFLADVTLLIYLLILLPLMITGFMYARKKKFIPHHKFVMTGIVILNWILISGVMIVSYADGVAPSVPDELNDRYIWLPTLHLITGGLSQLLATYLVFRMWFENSLPSWIMVDNIKRYMRLTLAGWIITALLGISIYILWYADPSSSDSSLIPPVATEAVELTDEPDNPVITEQPVPEPVQTEQVDDDNDIRDANRAQIEALEERLEALEDRAKDRDDDDLEEQVEALLDRLDDLDDRAADFDEQFAEIEAAADQLEAQF